MANKKKYETEAEQRAALVEIEKLLADGKPVSEDDLLAFGLDGQSRNNPTLPEDRQVSGDASETASKNVAVDDDDASESEDVNSTDEDEGWLSSSEDCVF